MSETQPQSYPTSQQHPPLEGAPPQISTLDTVIGSDVMKQRPTTADGQLSVEAAVEAARNNPFSGHDLAREYREYRVGQQPNTGEQQPPIAPTPPTA